jgi:hypothetical protein
MTLSVKGEKGVINVEPFVRRLNKTEKVSKN